MDFPNPNSNPTLLPQNPCISIFPKIPFKTLPDHAKPTSQAPWKQRDLRIISLGMDKSHEDSSKLLGFLTLLGIPGWNMNVTWHWVAMRLFLSLLLDNRQVSLLGFLVFPKWSNNVDLKNPIVPTDKCQRPEWCIGVKLNDLGWVRINSQGPSSLQQSWEIWGGEQEMGLLLKVAQFGGYLN